jgi:tRNA-dihydrouridine synthase B
MNKTDFVTILSKRQLLLPPLSGFTDYPYRTILSRFSPPFIITEMVNAKAVIMKNRKTMEMLKIVEGEHKNGVQLLGNDPFEMAQAAEKVHSMGFDYIDINMGCTVKKVISKGQGVALMKNEQLACDIVESVSNSVDIPVTVKMRLGYCDQTRNVISLSKKLEGSGAVALTIHGRTGEKKFGPNLEYETISQVARSLSIPVVANGGITPMNALTVLKKTDAIAVMPGRSIIGNPWVITEIRCLFEQIPYLGPTLEQKKKMVLDHGSLLCDFYGERSGIVRFRKILPRYFETCQNLRGLKHDVTSINILSEVETLIGRIHETAGIILYN